MYLNRFADTAALFQALGGAMLNPVALSIVRNVFHDPDERARAIGMWSATFGASLAVFSLSHQLWLSLIILPFVGGVGGCFDLEIAAGVWRPRADGAAYRY